MLSSRLLTRMLGSIAFGAAFPAFRIASCITIGAFFSNVMLYASSLSISASSSSSFCLCCIMLSISRSPSVSMVLAFSTMPFSHVYCSLSYCLSTVSQVLISLLVSYMRLLRSFIKDPSTSPFFAISFMSSSEYRPDFINSCIAYAAPVSPPPCFIAASCALR